MIEDLKAYLAEPGRCTATEAEQLRAIIEAGTVRGAANATGKSRGSLRDTVDRVRRRVVATPPIPVPVAEPVPDRMRPVAELIEHREKQFAQRKAHASAMLWRRFHVPARGPYALHFFGDPHIDDDGCDLTLFNAHAALAAKMSADTGAWFAANIGDTTNNWTGRLTHLWAQQGTSAEEARAMVRHYLAESGIPWFLWLCGNHDMWSGPVGRDVFERHKPHYVQMSDWDAKVTLVSPNGHELRVWASHNFKGKSIWNNLHGLERAAQMNDWAHLYVAGHHHDCGLRQGENADRRFVYNLMRVRGFKFFDDYATVNGFGEYQHGASGVAIIDPDGSKLNAVTCFMDPFEAADFLAFKRLRAVA